MTPDDLRKLSTSPTLFNLDRIISPRIIKALYLLGLAAIVMWAITHLFATFGASFGAGLWGLLEIAVFGLLAFVGLRIACEAMIIFFREHEKTAAKAEAPKPSANLFDDVKDALEELAEDDAPAETKAVTSRSSSRSSASRSSSSRSSSRSSAGGTAKKRTTRKSTSTRSKSGA